jgi:hypothetical protein
MNKKIALVTLRNVIAAGIYIFGVSQLMYHGNTLFGKEDNSLMPFALLLLFSVSAAIVGSLLFGQAAIQFLNKKNKEAVESAAYSILWLFVITAIVLIILGFID